MCNLETESEAADCISACFLMFHYGSINLQSGAPQSYAMFTRRCNLRDHCRHQENFSRWLTSEGRGRAGPVSLNILDLSPLSIISKHLYSRIIGVGKVATYDRAVTQ